MMAKPTRAVELHYAMTQFLIIKIIVLIIIIILFYFSVFVICILKMVTIVI